jgi:hypothetical protein
MRWSRRETHAWWAAPDELMRVLSGDDVPKAMRDSIAASVSAVAVVRRTGNANKQWKSIFQLLIHVD